ncbi:MAG: anaerobic glycerol-3-phosphate dehydrogenase subunit A [Chloroflexi bacterium CFX4]|nr:anaerobic glycerol-3-phosphate dehydrogenase subunit A [Chloroflexi bacterium CFX4]MDL1922782.1 anaerobic glycerol-3-phosphate dehydrogenase subunit A [Chloroflexi bacterium CFX3]
MQAATSLNCDVLVIGGGATGAGVLLDLAQRGLRVVLAEQNDIATGTSGRYHGLLHSGGRYAVRDPESARECIEENAIVRRIAPHTLEDTGGWFAAFPPDDPEYIPHWLAGCKAVGIPTESVTLAQALKEEPHLNPKAYAIYRVPDAACDSFELVHTLTEAAAAFGGITLNYHRVCSIEKAGGKVIGALLENRRNGAQVRVHAGAVVNAAGPWAGEIAKMAGADIHMTHDRGIMVAMNVRWVNTIINRLATPGDGDILVPVGTVCVIGTTSVVIDRPDDLDIPAEEVTQMLDAAEVMIPDFRKARALRAWAGVRPLYDPPQKREGEAEGGVGEDGRFITRSFRALSHADVGAAGMLSIVGGKLTTYRQMAEKIADEVCQYLGVRAVCRTAETALPKPSWFSGNSRRLHSMTHRLHQLEHAPTHNNLICECEIVTRDQLEAAIKASPEGVSLDDLRRDLRLGMGPCQAGFCGYRAAGVLGETANLPPAESIAALATFIQERFRGNRPLLWGHQLRQALLDEMIYRRALGVPSLQPEAHATSD